MYGELFHELAQNGRISDASQSAGRAERQATSVAEQLAQVEERVDWLVLSCQAMWEVLAECIPDADNVLREKIFDIDMRDGELDGSIGGGIVHCVDCGKKIRSKRASCMYCGAVQPKGTLFEK